MNQIAKIPKPKDKVQWLDKVCEFVSCNLGGKCRLRLKGRIISNVDVTELTIITE